MCGIACIFGGDPAAIGHGLGSCVARLTHRGPDDQGVELIRVGEAVLGLGQRRLSIIDLSSAGHQPMVHPQTGDVIVYNGEVYNFGDLRAELEAAGSRFIGHSDTEVILHALSLWGPKALERLNGMFALVFYHKATNTLIAARDPIGMKPLYVAQTGEALVLASEVRSVLATGLISPYISLPAVCGVLAFGAVQEPLTFFKQIEAFPAGTWRRYQLEPNGKARRLEEHRFWSIPTEIDEGLTGAGLIERVRGTIEQAVTDHLISDVPVGVFLSSGLDSTIMAGLAARHTAQLRTLTVGFSMDSPELSESGAAAETARVLGVTHADIQISSIEAERATVEWLDSLDQPSVDGLNTFVISKAVRAAGIVVALSGLGGDELFGGYPSFEDVPRFARTASRLSWAPPALRGLIGMAATARRGRTVRAKAAEMLRIGNDPLRLYLHRRRLMSDAQLADLGLDPLHEGLDRSCLPRSTFDAVAPAGPDILAAVSRYEAQFYMGNMLLRDTDANGMAHSLEIRPPLLDKRVMDLGFRIPGASRLPDGRARKHLLRAAFPDLLRPELLNQPKRGFWLPIRRWMVGPLRPACEEALAHVKSLAVFRSEAVDRLWRRFLTHPDSQVWSSAFMLCVLGSYMRQIRSWAPSPQLPSGFTLIPAEKSGSSERHGTR